jgi:hypothetical protein
LRLRVGILLGIVPFILIGAALASPWFSIHAVGPDFRTVGPDGPTPEDETRQLDGEWTLFQFRFFNETWNERDLNPEPGWVTSTIEGDGSDPQTAEVYLETTIAMVAGIGALFLGLYGMYNIAARDRYRWFTSASFFLAAVLFIGGCYHYGMDMPDAMWSDATSGDSHTFGALFEPYIDPEGGEPGYYFEFDGGYPADDPRLREQLQYGPGSGWWLAGAAGIFCLIASAVLVAAPTYEMERGDPGETYEVVRYVPIPTVTNVRRRRRYPKRMPAVSRNSPTYKRRKE